MRIEELNGLKLLNTESLSVFALLHRHTSRLQLAHVFAVFLTRPHFTKRFTGGVNLRFI